MTRSKTRTVTCERTIAEQRLEKAVQFLSAATTIRDFANDESEIGDAFVTLCVHAGIAAADTICCVVLGEHAQGENHHEATALLQRVTPDGKALANALEALVSVKTKAGYGAQSVSADERKRSLRSAEKLVTPAKDRLA
jgi:hypothetical protein